MTRTLASLWHVRSMCIRRTFSCSLFPNVSDYILVQPQQNLDPIRDKLLPPFNVTCHAPDMVSLYLFEPNGWVVENFNDKAVDVVLNGKTMNIPARGWVHKWE